MGWTGPHVQVTARDRFAAECDRARGAEVSDAPARTEVARSDACVPAAAVVRVTTGAMAAGFGVLNTVGATVSESQLANGPVVGIVPKRTAVGCGAACVISLFVIVLFSLASGLRGPPAAAAAAAS